MILTTKVYKKDKLASPKWELNQQICNNIPIRSVLIQQFGISYLPNSRNY
jgi:hypothetical protein